MICGILQRARWWVAAPDRLMLLTIGLLLGFSEMVITIHFDCIILGSSPRVPAKYNILWK